MKPSPSYTPIGPEVGTGDYGDPWTIPGYAPTLEEQFDETWIIQTHPAESVIGSAFAFGHRPMALVADTTRRAIGARNGRTGEVQFHPMTQAKFGWEQLPKHRMKKYHDTGLQMVETPLARALQDNSAQAPHIDMNQLWVSRGGDLQSQPKQLRIKRYNLGSR